MNNKHVSTAGRAVRAARMALLLTVVAAVASGQGFIMPNAITKDANNNASMIGTCPAGSGVFANPPSGTLCSVASRVTATETRGYTHGGVYPYYNYFDMMRLDYKADPAVATPHGAYRGLGVYLEYPATNNQSILTLRGATAGVQANGLGTVSEATGMSVGVSHETPGAGTLTAGTGGSMTVTHGDGIMGTGIGIDARASQYSYTVAASSSVLTAGNFVASSDAYDTPGGVDTTSTNGTVHAINSRTDLGQYSDPGGVVLTTTSRGIAHWLRNYLGSTITDSYGLYLSTPLNNGTITNHYGAYIADQTVGGSVLNYNLYSAGVAAKNKLEGPLEANSGGTVPAWSSYALKKIANGVNGCANANGCWQVNGVLGANVSAGLTQDVVLFQLPANGFVSNTRIQTTLVFTGTTTILAGLGTATKNVFYSPLTYNLALAVNDTNFVDTANVGSTTKAAVNVVASLVSTVDNLDQLAANCEVTYLLLWGRTK